MSESKPPLSTSLNVRLSTMMFLQYAIWGAWLPFLWSFLFEHREMGPDQIGTMFAAGAVGAIIGPFIAPAFMHWAGPGGLYLHTALVHLALLAYIGYRFLQREPELEEEHGRFVDSLATTQTASHYYEEEIAVSGASGQGQTGEPGGEGPPGAAADQQEGR